MDEGAEATTDNGIYSGWAILSLMGHRQRVGIVSEAEMYGGKLLRIDVPCGDEMVTEYYGTSAVYSLEPISEEVGQTMHLAKDFRPVNPLGFRDPTEDEVQREVKNRAGRISYDRSDGDDDIAF